MKEIQLFLSVVFTTASAALLDGSDVVHSGDCVCAGLNIVGLNKGNVRVLFVRESLTLCSI